MRRKLLVTLLVASAIFGIASVLTTPAAAASSCPKGSHLITCADGRHFCCPNNALCIFCLN